VAVVARRVAGLLEGPERWPLGDRWAGASLQLPTHAPSTWCDALTGRALVAEAGTLPLPVIFAELPVALLGAGLDTPARRTSRWSA
jgi:maltooligosyltrehalose synthase